MQKEERTVKGAGRGMYDGKIQVKEIGIGNVTTGGVKERGIYRKK